MEIPTHRLREIQLAAYLSHEEALKRAKSSLEKASLPTQSADEALIILSRLREIAGGGDIQRALTLDGTPMGEQMTAELYRDDDGTDLQASPLADMLLAIAGCHPPLETIASWPLEQRKLVAAWLRAVIKNTDEAIETAVPNTAGGDEAQYSDEEIAQIGAIRDQQKRNARTIAPDFIDLAWFSDVMTLDDLQWTESDVAEWLARGPWGVKSYQPDGVPTNPASDEWVTIRTQEGQEVEESPKVFTALAGAQLAAAQANHAQHRHDALEAAGSQAAAAESEGAPIHPDTEAAAS